MRTLSKSSASLSDSSVVICALLAALFWGLYFYFGHHISYADDDYGVITPALRADLLHSLLTNLRPLEYWIARCSALAGHGIWVLASLVLYIAIAVVTLRICDVACGRRPLPVWAIAFAAATPLAALAYFQIDTVSQALANVFGVLFALSCIHCLTRDVGTALSKLCWQAAGYGLLCILSKETAYGIVFFGSCLVILKYRRAGVAPLLLLLALLSGAILLAVYDHDLSVGAFYGFKINPLYWPFTLFFSAVVSLSPIPTSVFLTHTWTATPALIALVAAGVVAALTGVILYGRTVVHSVVPGLSQRWRLWLRGEFASGELICAFAVCALFPSMIFKANELYATQMQPFLKAALLMAIAPKAVRSLDTAFWSAICALWVVASTVNTAFYSVATGYRPVEDRAGRSAFANWIYDNIQAATARRTSAYSSYTYHANLHRLRVGDCLFDVVEPRVCLKRDISTGFPVWIGDPPAVGSFSPVMRGVWEPRQSEISGAGMSRQYSCDVLESKLRLLLRYFGARNDYRVGGYGCERGYDTPSDTVRVRMLFSVLVPAGAGLAVAHARATPVDGGWHDLEAMPNDPRGLEDSDCELLQRFRDTVLPLFTTQTLDTTGLCGSGAAFRLKIREFAPLPAQAQAAASQ